MRRELQHFTIGSSYGGNQNWFRTLMMRMGGCGAETACDSCLYFALHRGLKELYPFDSDRLTKEDYVAFAHRMERYLWPRMTGIDRLDIYMDGLAGYLRDCGEKRLTMSALDGGEPYERAARTVREQIDAGYPVPMLLLNHRDRAFKDYNWHWFLLNGYDAPEGAEDMSVRAVTYSAWRWLDLQRLWDAGFERRGGLILYALS